MAERLRKTDPDRWATTLFAPPALRPSLLALYTVNHEIARTRETVTEPLLGQIRLRWWQDEIAAIYETGATSGRHEALPLLAAAIDRHDLPRAAFERLIAARHADLATEPPADWDAVEDYVEGTSATLVALALAVLGAGEAAATAGRAAGLAYAYVGLARALPLHRGQGRHHVPAGLSMPEAAKGLVLRAREALAAPLPQRPRAARPALLLAVLARHDAARLERANFDPSSASAAARDRWRLWRLAFANWSGRV